MLVTEYLFDCVNFPVTENAVLGILSVRGVPADAEIEILPRRLLRLCEADLLVWLCKSPNRTGGVTDKDNGWEHSDGGITLTDADRKFLLRQANAIYAEYGEPIVAKNVVRIVNFGIKPANPTHNPGYAW